MSEWPISQTNAIGVSQTPPQSRAFPISFVSNAGVSGPSLRLTSGRTLDVCPLACLVSDLLLVGRRGRRRPDVDVDDVVGVHDERALSGSVHEHPVERGRLDDLAFLLGERPDR